MKRSRSKKVVTIGEFSKFEREPLNTPKDDVSELIVLICDLGVSNKLAKRTDDNNINNTTTLIMSNVAQEGVNCVSSSMTINDISLLVRGSNANVPIPRMHSQLNDRVSFRE